MRNRRRGAIAARGISDEMVEAFQLAAAPDAWTLVRSLPNNPAA